MTPEPAETPEAFLFRCCAHCGCSTGARFGHDDTCANGCNDDALRPPVVSVTEPAETADSHVVCFCGAQAQPHEPGTTPCITAAAAVPAVPAEHETCGDPDRHAAHGWGSDGDTEWCVGVSAVPAEPDPNPKNATKEPAMTVSASPTEPTVPASEFDSVLRQYQERDRQAVALGNEVAALRVALAGLIEAVTNSCDGDDTGLAEAWDAARDALRTAAALDPA